MYHRSWWALRGPSPSRGRCKNDDDGKEGSRNRCRILGSVKTKKLHVNQQEPTTSCQGGRQPAHTRAMHAGFHLALHAGYVGEGWTPTTLPAGDDASSAAQLLLSHVRLPGEVPERSKLPAHARPATAGDAAYSFALFGACGASSELTLLTAVSLLLRTRPIFPVLSLLGETCWAKSALRRRLERLGAVPVLVPEIQDVRCAGRRFGPDSKPLPTDQKQSYFDATYSILSVWNLTAYRAVLALDADLIVMRNLDHVLMAMLARPEIAEARTPEGCLDAVSVQPTRGNYFNTGVRSPASNPGSARERRGICSLCVHTDARADDHPPADIAPVSRAGLGGAPRRRRFCGGRPLRAGRQLGEPVRHWHTDCGEGFLQPQAHRRGAVQPGGHPASGEPEHLVRSQDRDPVGRETSAAGDGAAAPVGGASASQWVQSESERRGRALPAQARPERDRRCVCGALVWLAEADACEASQHGGRH